MAHDADRRHRHALGVDFGTSNTVAVARWPDGRARPILIDGSPLLPSAVYAQPDGQLIVGRDAVHSARLDPARFEPNPKRRVDDGTVLLGEREVPVADLFASVLARVAEEWHRAVGPVRPDVTLTCPATWGATRRTLLADAAADAGLSGSRLVAEPVAAATYFAEVLGRDVPIGSVVVVHDFGAGTFDASVVARTAEGFEVLAVDGRDDIGGLDVDAVIVDHLGRLCGERDAAAWQRLRHPTTVEERRAQRQLWDDVRVAKERLSRTQAADLMVPLLDVEVHLTRDELEALAGPLLSQTVQVTHEVLRWADLADGRLAGVFLVGGASRIPLVATLLHRALGEAPVVIEQPELVVAEGSILADAAMLASGPAAPGPTSEMRLVSGMRAGRSSAWPGDDAVTVRRVPSDDAVTVRRVPSDDAVTVRRAPSDDAVTVRRAPSDDAVTVRRAPSDDAVTVRGGAGLPPPAVDPWPHARDEPWRPDPDHTVLTEPSAAPPPGQAPTAGPARAARAASGTTARGSARPGRVEPAAPRSIPAPRKARDPRAPDLPEAADSRAVARPFLPAKRTGGGFVRLLQVMLSLIVLVTVPVVAMVVAYGYDNGTPLTTDALNLARHVADLLGLR